MLRVVREENSYLAIQGKSFKLKGSNESGYGFMAFFLPSPAPDESSLQRHKQCHALITSPSSSSSSGLRSNMNLDFVRNFLVELELCIVVRPSQITCLASIYK